MSKFSCLSLGFFIVFGFLFSGLFAGRVFAQSGNSVSGFVFDASHQPMGNVYVELQTDLYSTVGRVRTTSNGFYAFRGLRDGSYVIKVLPFATNYREQTKSISLVSFSVVPGRGAASEQVDFYLQPDKNASAQPLGAPGVVFAQNVPEEAKKLYDEGIRLLGEKRENEAFESLKKSLDIFPDYYQALDRLGTEYVLRGSYRLAYPLLVKALQINPKSFTSTFGLGLAQYRLEEYAEAEKSLKLAIQIEGESANGHLWLGIVYHHNGKFAEAEKSLLFANKLTKGEADEIHWQLARLYNDQKRYKDAANELELFLKYNPNARDKDKIQETIQKLRQKSGE